MHLVYLLVCSSSRHIRPATPSIYIYHTAASHPEVIQPVDIMPWNYSPPSVGWSLYIGSKAHIVYTRPAVVSSKFVDCQSPSLLLVSLSGSGKPAYVCLGGTGEGGNGRNRNIASVRLVREPSKRNGQQHHRGQK